MHGAVLLIMVGDICVCDVIRITTRISRCGIILVIVVISLRNIVVSNIYQA